MSRRIAIIVAMKREIAPLVDWWRRERKEVRRGKFGAASSYSCEDKIVLVSGIGSEFAGMAAGYATQSIGADLIVSAGLAGALREDVGLGSVLRPVEVVDAGTGEKYANTRATPDAGVLVTAASVLSRAEKRELAAKYGAAAVDMEAAAVAEVAREAGIAFAAVKAISDPLDFDMPPMDRFVSNRGRFKTGAFLTWVAPRPRFWQPTIQLARNSARAAEALAKELRRL